MMRPLHIGPDEKMLIARLEAYARENIIDHARMMRIMNRSEPPIGDNYHHVISIPHQYRVVFSYEIHKKKRYRHVSVSIPIPGKMPNIQAFNAIAKEFGFKYEYPDQTAIRRGKQYFHIENDAALNLLELMEDSFEPRLIDGGAR